MRFDHVSAHAVAFPDSATVHSSFFACIVLLGSCLALSVDVEGFQVRVVAVKH